jgi:hypothetical protein
MNKKTDKIIQWEEFESCNKKKTCEYNKLLKFTREAINGVIFIEAKWGGTKPKSKIQIVQEFNEDNNFDNTALNNKKLNDVDSLENFYIKKNDDETYSMNNLILGLWNHLNNRIRIVFIHVKTLDNDVLLQKKVREAIAKILVYYIYESIDNEEEGIKELFIDLKKELIGIFIPDYLDAENDVILNYLNNTYFNIPVPNGSNEEDQNNIIKKNNKAYSNIINSILPKKSIPPSKSFGLNNNMFLQSFHQPSAIVSDTDEDDEYEGSFGFVDNKFGEYGEEDVGGGRKKNKRKHKTKKRTKRSTVKKNKRSTVKKNKRSRTKRTRRMRR